MIASKAEQEIKWNYSLLQELLSRRRALELIAGSKRKALESAPEGSLRIIKIDNHNQYYRRKDPKDTNGKYILKEDIDLAARLAQKDYDKNVIKIAEKELTIVDKYIKVLKENQLEKVYDHYSQARKELIVPILVADEEFVEKWKSKEYSRMQFGDISNYYSTSGTRVRSKAEVMIADMLEYYGVPYRYEYPVELDGLGIVRPDFLCLNISRRKEIIWEHFGMMDNISYANKNIKKIHYYEQNGYHVGENMIMTFETSQFGLDTNLIKNKIEKYLI